MLIRLEQFSYKELYFKNYILNVIDSYSNNRNNCMKYYIK